MERELIDRCRNGDKLALEQLYKYYAPKMKAVCLRYVHSNYEAEDVFQDAFIKILRNVKNFNHQGSFDGWIRRIVVHSAIDHCKKNLVYNTISFEDVKEPEDDSCDIANQLSVNDLLEIIRKIPPGYNMVFNLYAIEGYDHAEIAEMLNITESSSRSQLCKARNFIKNILKQYNFFINDKKNAG